LSGSDLQSVNDYVGFSPSSIPGLALWLDADDETTFTFSSGTLVSQWDDKSGEDNHVTQGTAASQPSRDAATLNGKAVVTFDGANDRMVTGANALGTVNQLAFVGVVKFATRANSDEYDYFYGVSGGTASAGAVVSFSYANPGASSYTGKYYLYGGGAVFTGPTLTQGSPFVFSQIAQTAAPRHQLYIDGVSQTVDAYTDTLSATGTLTLGNTGIGGVNHPFNGYLAEGCWYVNSPLSEDNRTELEAYLATKWGL